MSSLGLGAIRSVYFSSVFVWYRARMNISSLKLRGKAENRERERVWEGTFQIALNITTPLDIVRHHNASQPQLASRSARGIRRALRTKRREDGLCGSGWYNHQQSIGAWAARS